MKGWLDKYNDGGPVQENYNDYSVSAPEGFQGDGYSNVGRNYSPAWGGQFEDGGNLPKAKDGWLETLKSNLNPYNWGVSDYSNKGNFNSAYASTKKTGEEEFIWNNKRYSVNDKNTPGQRITHRDDFKGNILSYAASGGQRADSYGNNAIGDAYRYFGGLPLKSNELGISKYKPTKSKDPNARYVSINNEQFLKDIKTYANIAFNDQNRKDVNDKYLKQLQATRPELANVDPNKLLLFKEVRDKHGNVIPDTYTFPTGKTITGDKNSSRGLGHMFISKGKDDKGDYISYYDTFNVDTGNPTKELGELLGATKPFEIYDRIYLDPKTGKPKMAMGGSMPGTVGFTYARTNDPAPSKGKYAKKTKASAENGKKVSGGLGIEDWWNNRKRIQSTYKMANDVDPFMKNWMNNPITQKRLDNQIGYLMRGNKPIDVINKNLNTLPVYDQQKMEGQKTSDFINNYKLQNNISYKYPDSQFEPYFNNLREEPGVGGVYVPDIHSVSVRDINNKGTLAHEMTHALGIQDEMETDMSIFYNQKPDPNYPKNSYEKNRYDYLKKDGMYPRVMEVRRELNLKPGQEVDKRIFNDVRLKKGSAVQDLRKMYDDSEIIKILNTIADNSDTKKSSIAENGTEMRYYQEGLDFKPKSISRDGSQLVKLDQLTNFTNYNTKQPGGWLDKYEG